MHRPSWFRDGGVVVSSAPTCGINKDGHEQFLVDPITGVRSADVIDDRLLEDVRTILAGGHSSTVSEIPLGTIQSKWIAVPTYYDPRADEAFDRAMQHEYKRFSPRDIGELIDTAVLTVRRGHGSPSLDQRIGDVPYIKVSDLRAGSVNINPTNMVPEAVAQAYWRGNDSGLKAYDLISPERASKNIGDFCVLLPGQERVVLTREMLVVRVGPEAAFDAFFLLWAMTLKVVRAQWRRVILMQTNREDVGQRYREIRIPYPPNRQLAEEVSEPFRRYYTRIESERSALRAYLNASNTHHFFLGAADETKNADDLTDEVATS